MARKINKERRERDRFRRGRASRGGKARETDGGRVQERFLMHWVIGTGWVHSHGMDEKGFPEVEVRDVPDFLAEPAAKLIRSVCDYMLDGGIRIRPGEIMQTSPRTSFRLITPEPMPGEEDHYAVARLQIVDLEQSCDRCTD